MLNLEQKSAVIDIFKGYFEGFYMSALYACTAIFDVLNMEQLIALAKIENVQRIKTYGQNSEGERRYFFNESHKKGFNLLAKDDFLKAIVDDYLKNKQDALIYDSGEFYSLLKILTPQQRVTIYDLMQHDLRDLIKTEWDFVYISAYLTPDQRQYVYEQVQDQLPNYITSMRGLYSVLENMPPDQREALYARMQPKLPILFYPPVPGLNLRSASKISVQSWGSELASISAERCTVICDIMKEDIVKSILDGDTKLIRRNRSYFNLDNQPIYYSNRVLLLRDFLSSFKVVNPINASIVCKSMRSEFPRIFKGRFGQNIAYVVLFDLLYDSNIPNAKLLDSVYDDLKDEICLSIKNFKTFYRLLAYINPENCVDICQKMNDQLSGFIQSVNEIPGINLSEAQRNKFFRPEKLTELYKAIETYIFRVVKSQADIDRIKSVYPESLHDLIQTKFDCLCLLDNIDKTRFGKKDTLMNEYVALNRQKIIELKDPEGLAVLKSEMTELYTKLSSESVKQIQAMATYSTVAKLGVFGKSITDQNAKIIKLRVREVPLDERDQIRVDQLINLPRNSRFNP